MVPGQGFEPRTIGLKVGLSDARNVPPSPFKTHSIFGLARQPFAPFHCVSQQSVLVAALTAAPAFGGFQHLPFCCRLARINASRQRASNRCIGYREVIRECSGLGTAYLGGTSADVARLI
jgi:hypothetical protein